MKLATWSFFITQIQNPPRRIAEFVEKVTRITPLGIQIKYFDAKSTPENPRWMMVDIEAVQEMEMVSLVDINNPALDEMPLVQRGQRLSVQPVSKSSMMICRMGGIA